MDRAPPEAAQPNAYNAPVIASGEPILTTPLRKGVAIAVLAACLVLFFLIGLGKL